MGILNVTPDSFSDGGRYANPAKALARARQIQAEGADWLDVGGESTRPGARAISAAEEKKRILPIIEKLATKLRIPISVDTSKAAVAAAALGAGAAMVNDVTALRDPAMAGVVARAGVPVILMHMRGTPRTMQKNPRYRRLIPEITAELQQAVRQALAAGIPRRNIWLDPGIGFGKRLQDNLALMRDLRGLKKLGFPIVVGPSRKAFIGMLTGQADPEKRVYGTAACVALAVAAGADMVRVHDVAEMRDAALIAQAISSAGGAYELS